MSTNSIFTGLGTRILKSQGAIVLAGAVALLAAASCTSATVSVQQPTGGQNPNGGNGGNNPASGQSCIVNCYPVGGSTGGGGATQSTFVPSKTCGNGVLEQGEDCDDGIPPAKKLDPNNPIPDTGCSAQCLVEANFLCPEPNKPCVDQRKCGNGVLTSDEICDDGNTADNDGCSANCQKITDGWQCRVPGKPCTPICGDGKLEGGENCDDGNTASGDGCSTTCQREPGADCPTPGQACKLAQCGNGVKETGEQCDCGNDATKLPAGCKGQNGLFYGDPNNPGCSKTCTKEPKCVDASGKTQACSTACGDGNIDPGEACDDGNQLDGDGCSSKCTTETGFVCTPSTHSDSSPCTVPNPLDPNGACLELPVIYRDFQPENVSPGGHPDFYFLGTKATGSGPPTTICVPNSGGPAKGNDSTARCWDIADSNLSFGKPIYNSKRTTNQCACQFSDWNIGNSGAHIPSTYTQAGNDSPISDGAAGYRGGNVGTAITFTNPSGSVTGTLKGYTASIPGGPIFNGVVPIVKDANSFKQWFNDDTAVNKTFPGVLEMHSIGTNTAGGYIYRYASTTHLAGADNGFYPLDKLNPSQITLCDLWPYWNHGNGTPIWATCQGDQYLFPPRVTAADCPVGSNLNNGCWVSNTPGVKHDSYFTDEARYFFVYDKTAGISLQFFGDDDLFVYINGILVLDLGGVHQQLPGKVVVVGDPGQATITEGGCLDATGNIATTQAGYVAAGCSPAGAPAPISPDDYRSRTVSLGLNDGKVYEIAIFGADRHPPESNFQLTLNGFSTKTSDCIPHCGDGMVTGGEECDCGDGTVAVPAGCLGPNNDALYGGCKTDCKWGPFCGDGVTQSPPAGPENCDQGSKNGSVMGSGGCTFGCKNPHYCGDGIIDSDRGEQCDLGSAVNGVYYDTNGSPSAVQTDGGGRTMKCTSDCKVPIISTH
jgi:cysteine-rich repeat protein